MKRALVIILILLLAAPVLAQYVAQDPTRYISNARILGLGKAYIGLADDVGSVFTNPAGMAGVESWQLSSLSGNFLEEYFYVSFSGLYPTRFGVLGLAFARSSIAGAWCTTPEGGTEDDPIYTIDPEQRQMGNYNNAFVVSYANRMNKINFLDRLPFADRLSVGANLKFFQSSLYGDEIEGGDAVGNELDLGVQFFPPQKWMQFGLTAQNLLPLSMGGKLQYGSGYKESYPVVLEAGSAFRVIGKKDAWRRVGGHEVTLALDFDMHPTLKNYPMCWHAGLEWQPISLLCVRAGLDQDAAGDGAGGLTTIMDSTYGVGLFFGGFRFDFAYRTFAGAPNIDNYFFSLSYAHQPMEVPKIPMTLELPPDKHITFDERAEVRGKVLDPRIRKLEVNGSPLKFGLRGDFTTSFNLEIGKNKIVVAGKDAQEKELGRARARLLRLKPFPDVPDGYWVRAPISLLAMQGIITGYPDGTFKPTGNITRAEMCTLLMKAKGVAGQRQATVFGDVSSTHWASGFISEAAQAGVVKGYPDGSFKPSANITRAEGLAMIARFAGVSQEAWARQFSDVAGAHWAAPIIAGAYNAGILEYLEGRPFEANKLLSRAETVEMLYRTQYVKELLAKDLLNWETY